jgi:uncharacterized coiled-coil protein SlyX
MAVSWLALLKMVPWTDVIGTAPAVAEAAKKLWSAASKKPPEQSVTGNQPGLSAESRIVALETQLAAVQTAASELHNQMLASSELIKALADQNAQLIKRAEIYRRWFLWLGGLSALVGIIAVTSLAFTLLR